LGRDARCLGELRVDPHPALIGPPPHDLDSAATSNGRRRQFDGTSSVASAKDLPVAAGRDRIVGARLNAQWVGFTLPNVRTQHCTHTRFGLRDARSHQREPERDPERDGPTRRQRAHSPTP
jgi:hypothetical protein